MNKNTKTWIIGFIEGDGSFFIRSNNTLGFEISQSKTDSQILYFIKKELGFGKVYHNDSTVSKYTINADLKSYIKLVKLIDNNLLLNKRIIQWDKWLLRLEEKSGVKVEKNIEQLTEVSWDNAWLSGFIDAEGCFRINYDKTNDRFQGKFTISQDEIEILEKIKDLLGNSYKGKITKDRNTYVLSFAGKKSKALLKTYLSKYPLKTKKRISYLKWLKCENMIEERKDKERIEKLRKVINRN